MLVLSRKQDQEIHVPDYGIKFRVLEVDGRRVRIGIDAPSDVRILRSELAVDPDDFEFHEDPSDFSDANFIWPLGVYFDPERAPTLPNNRIHNRLPKHFESSTAMNSQRVPATLSH